MDVNVSNKVGVRNIQKSWFAEIRPLPKKVGMAKATKIHPADLLAMAGRLRALRQSTGMTQAAFCAEYGFTQTQWSNFEKANGRISIDAALVLNQRLKVPLDWIYTGETAWLPAGLRDAIDKVQAESA